jgi:hypothetical protein
MNAHINRFDTAVSRRQVMISRRPFLRYPFGGRADAAVIAGERTAGFEPMVSIAPDGTITIMSAATGWGRDR